MRVTSKFKGSQHHVTIPAPSLASYFIAEAAESTSEVFTTYIPGEASSRNDLIFDHMESDDARFLGGVEMAGDRVSDHCLELIQRVRFREDGKTERPGVVAAFRGFLDGKDDLA
jgi:hypothetical protein